ncbi:hypothetical protein M2164_001916 [Streptomyces sp. SAI-208]|uniref:hypothetical protein n=1 Tax=unclassified Streptomyces TaxID=2593676 RepID=UPI002474B593|nr:MULTISPECIES: hypothetical protein [unclassified Streptomyces]MDH6515439.1 hypothetical protein [Streptomyces sp. SAI-090]MDH6547651.1 hypothetical protein [Streptomyces sp. SAI-041]MDH6566737.1 hypothetical protein [Streptomyces sp. SAI-117]MDH6588324.1 hypothetical protein [Streptomyces sp. SAI-133]MDH6606281.1 hypothetical protein [Streptomyces sp. SAI-208]
MRRTARLRALTVVLFALGVTLGYAAPSAFADPAAEVSPSSVQPGGSVTVSVSCDPGTGTPPATLDATSEAFESQTVRLQLVPGNDDQVSGPAYSGTARVSADQELQEGTGGTAPDSAWTVDGTCPTADRAPGKAWSATFTVTRGADTGTSHRPCPEPRTATCETAAVQKPVRAGQGGSFTDSVPALVAGGLLIAGAVGGAVHRLRRRAPGADA